MTPAELYAMDGAAWLAAPVGEDAQPSEPKVVKLARGPSIRCLACGETAMTDCCEDGTGFCHSRVCGGRRQRFHCA